MCTNEGVVKIIPEENRFLLHYTHQYKNTSVINNSVRGVYSSVDTLIVATYDYLILKIKGKEKFIKRMNNYSLLKQKNYLWNGTASIRRYNFDLGEIDLTAKTNGSESWGMYSLNDSIILLCTTNGFVKFNTKKNVSEDVPYGTFPKPTFVYRCFKDKLQQLIAVASNGIYILNQKADIIDYYGYGSKVKNHKLPCRTLHDIYIDKDENYWIASDGEGLFRWNRNKNRFQQFGKSNGFISNTIYCIQEDDYNNLWLSTDYGLVRFNKHTHYVKTYTTKEGIADNEFNRTSQFKDKTGRIYFGGVNGLTSFLPSDFSNDTIRKTFPFKITNISCYNEKNSSLERLEIESIQETGLIISDNIKFFTLSFSLLDFEDRPHLYAYRIDGIDKDWIYTKENNLKYTKLPYGNYTLRVKAQTGNGYWNRQEIVVPLQIIMPFYKTWWFITLIAISFAGIVLLIAYLIFRQRVRHLNSLNNLRLKIASDLHDEVGGLLNKTAIQSELARSEVNEGAKALLDKITENCRRAISGMRDIMWNMDPRNDSLDELFDRMKEYTMEMLNDDFDYSVTTEETGNIALQPEIKQAVYLIYKEAVNNILKHAKKGKVEIVCKINKKEIFLSFFNESDFVKKEITTGQGLKNIKMRTEKLKGLFHINTKGGVQINVQIPLN